MIRKNNFKKKVRPVDPADLPRNKAWLIYGQSGTGKSSIAATFPTPIAFIDFKDEGSESIEDVPGVKVFPVTSLEELEDVYWYLSHNAGKFKTIVWDTVTGFQRIVVEEICRRKKLKKGQKPGDWGTMKMKEWGEVGGVINAKITEFRDLGTEMVFIAQQRVFDPAEGDDDQEDELTPEVGPACIKSISSHLCASVSFIGHTFIRMTVVKSQMKKKRRPEYCIRVGPSPVYITKVRKSRRHSLPDYISNPDYKSLTQLKRGKHGSQVEERTR